ncbi:MAG: FMN-binding negative transcriptional regulator, partial [Cytophagaceae bacterium]|nr:FMN-binding negative transcriptional regulator [Gemmatimonadaceae bacterium]
MYVPQSFAEHDQQVVYDFIEQHPLATLTTSANGLYATHLPLLLDRERGLLEGHIARANPHHRHVAPGSEALVIITGPDAYITPEWYASKQEHGRVVPTWNYVAVHVYGTVTFIDDPAYLRGKLEALTNRHEGERERPWHVDDAPADYIERQLAAIVGVQISIVRMEGKWKMSQNRPAADIQSVVEGLSSAPSTIAR